MSYVDPRRARLALQLSTEAALRMGEVLGLRWSDLNLSTDEPTVSAGSGDRRNVPLPADLIELAREMQEHADQTSNRDGLVFDTDPPSTHASQRFAALTRLLADDVALEPYDLHHSSPGPIGG